MSVWRHPAVEPTSVTWEAQYADEFREGDIGNSEYWVLVAAKQALFQLLGPSKDRPEGVQYRMPGPDEQVVLTVDDWVVTARLEKRS